MLPDYYEFYNPVKIVAGRKAVDNLPYEIDKLGCKKPLIITDKGVVKAGLIDIIKKSFYDSHITDYHIYDETPSDSSVRIVNEVVKIYKSNNCDVLIAVGGGSSIDTAKGVNIVVTEKSDDLKKFMGAEMLNKPMDPMIVIPTTAGTGSEVTLVAVIKDEEKNVKMEFTSYFLLPKVAILDPRMTLSLPPKITAATGMDALTHATEAYISVQKNPMSDAYAFNAIKLISENLIEVVKNPKDEKRRFAMANAATMAGVSFSNAIVGIVHCLGHSAGALCKIHHGTAMSIFLPFGLKHNLNKVEEYIGELLLPLGGADEYAKTPKSKRAYRAIDLIYKLRDELKEICGLPTTLKEAGVKEEQFDDIAKNAINDGAHIFNPEDMDFNEALKIIKEAYN